MKSITVEYLVYKSHFIFQDQICLKHAMVTSPTGKGVIVMGGETNSEKNSKAMFELTQSMNWTILEQTLQMDHYGVSLAIPIPDELVSKQD